MARIAGINTEKDTKGNISKVIFDFKKHGAKLMPILLEMGAIEEDTFEKEWNQAVKTGYTVEGLRNHMDKFIDDQWKKE